MFKYTYNLFMRGMRDGMRDTTAFQKYLNRKNMIKREKRRCHLLNFFS